MNIYEAAKLAHKLGTGFYKSGESSYVTFVPTNTSSCCLIISHIRDFKPGQRWQPSLDDLVYEDWNVWGYSGDELRYDVQDL